MISTLNTQSTKLKISLLTIDISLQFKISSLTTYLKNTNNLNTLIKDPSLES